MLTLETITPPVYTPTKGRGVYPWKAGEEQFEKRTDKKQTISFKVDANTTGEDRKKLTAALSSRNRTLKDNNKPYRWRWKPEGEEARVWLEAVKS